MPERFRQAVAGSQVINKVLIVCFYPSDSKTLPSRRELEHFDHVMKDEFEEGFRAYR